MCIWVHNNETLQIQLALALAVDEQYLGAVMLSNMLDFDDLHRV